MICKVGLQLHEAMAAVELPDAPDLLLGLTEAGLRNRARQKAERKVKIALDLEKHRRWCRACGGGPDAESDAAAV